MKPTDLLLDFGRPVAFYPGLVKYLGSVNAVVFFCQIFYWYDKKTSDLGVHKTIEDIELETGLTYSEQRTARKHLKKCGVLVENHKRLLHKVYYDLNLERVNELLLSANQGSSNPRNEDSLIRGVAKPQFDLTENTTEITSEITESAHANAPDLNNPTPAEQHPATEAENAGASNAAPLAGLTLGNHPMLPDWQPAKAELVPMLRRSSIAQPVCECLAEDPELLATFVNHNLANPGREYTSTGWTNRLATWLTRDWQQLGRPTTAAEYHQKRGTRPANLPECPLSELHALWEQHLGHVKPTPPLADWLKSKSAKRLADRWADGFTAPLASDPQATRYHDTQSGLGWWEGLFKALSQSAKLANDDWITLIHLGNPDTFSQVTAQLAFERQQGGAQ